MFFLSSWGPAWDSRRFPSTAVFSAWENLLGTIYLMNIQVRFRPCRLPMAESRGCPVLAKGFRSPRCNSRRSLRRLPMAGPLSIFWYPPPQREGSYRGRCCRPDLPKAPGTELFCGLRTRRGHQHRQLTPPTVSSSTTVFFCAAEDLRGVSFACPACLIT